MIASSSLHNSFYNLAKNTPNIKSSEDERALIKAAQGGDTRAMDQLVAAYMRFIISMARPYSKTAEIDVLVNEGTLGFMRSVMAFDHTMETRLSAYCRYWIKERLVNHINQARSLVGSGSSPSRRRAAVHLNRLINQRENQLRQEGKHFTYHEILVHAADKLGISVEQAISVSARGNGDMSLNQSTSTTDDGTSSEWQDSLVCSNNTPEEQYVETNVAQKQKELVIKAMATLNDRERHVITERRLTTNPTTLEVLGHELGISKERVRQIEMTAIGKLQAALETQRDLAVSLFVT